MEVPTWRVLIDWDADSGLALGDWEHDADGWQPAGTLPPTLVSDTTRSYHGTASGKVTWDTGGTGPAVMRVWGNLTAGRTYTLSAWVWVPVGSPAVRWAVTGVGSGTASAVTGAWTQITYALTATGTQHVLTVEPATAPTAGQQVWVDYALITGVGEDVTTRVLDADDISVVYGRDQARASAPPRPGESNLLVDNDSKDYSPEYGASPLAGMVGPGRDIRVTATYSDRVYTMFAGVLDDFDLDPHPGESVVEFSTIDRLGRLRQIPVSTALHPSVRTGDAVHRVLDAIGWTGRRDIDPGGSTLRWWWEETDDAYDALLRIVASEGPPALIHIGADGGFVFRDRHHRLLRTASTTTQATYRDTGGALQYVGHDGFRYDAGFNDVVNVAEFDTVERVRDHRASPIWSTTSPVTLAPGESKVYRVISDDLWIDVITPTQSSNPDLDVDFLLTVNTTVDIGVDRTSGQAFTVTVRVPTTAPSAVTLLTGRLRGYEVTQAGRTRVTVEDPESIRVHGRCGYDPPGSTPHITPEDARAIGQVILGQRAQRLPTVTITLENGDGAHLLQQLGRDLSDRVRIVESLSGTDADFYVDTVAHTVSDTGNRLTTRFGAEKVRTIPGDVFRFDTAGRGFDDGRFGPSGLDDPATIFVFDQPGRGFNDGLLSH